MRIRIVLLAVSALAAAGCGPTQYEATSKTTSREEAVTPKGTISGQVLTSRLAPLEGVDVTLTFGGEAPSKKASTDATGSFAFTGLPAGSDVLVTITKAGFATLRTTARIPAAAGNFPLEGANASVGPFTLAELNATVRFTVLTSRGQPASGARATLEISPAGTDVGRATSNIGNALSAVTVDATVDAAGLLTFANVPAPVDIARVDGEYRVWVGPLDANADGLPETGGYAAAYSGEELVIDPSPRLLQLPPVSAGPDLRVDGGNVGSLRTNSDNVPTRNLVKPGEALLLAFNRPINAQSVLVRLTDEDGSENVGFTKALGAGGQLLTITPTEAVVVGAEYNIRVQAVSLSGAVYQKTGFFFGGDVASPAPFSLASIKYQETSTTLPSRLNSNEKVYVFFNQALSRLSPDNANVQVFFSADINGDNVTGGNTVGEIGNYQGRGFELTIDEPTKPIATTVQNPEVAQFPLVSSGYTTRYSFTYTGNVVLDPGAIEITIAFSKLASRTNTTYLTAWGQVPETDVKASAAIIPTPTDLRD